MPMLRFFRTGDGTLARFNGAGPTPTDALATVLAYDDVEGAPVRAATNSGYVRLECGPTLLICDIGPAPALSVSTQRACRLPRLRDELRQLSDHRQLRHALDRPRRLDSVCPLDAGAFDAELRGHVVRRVHRDRRQWQPHRRGLALERPAQRASRRLPIRATISGSRARMTATRPISASATRGNSWSRRTGCLISSEDKLSAPGGLQSPDGLIAGEYAIRFHLHPTVRAELGADGQSALLKLKQRRDLEDQLQRARDQDRGELLPRRRARAASRPRRSCSAA